VNNGIKRFKIKLIKRAGKPLGSPSGRHLTSNTITSKNDSLGGEEGIINSKVPEVVKYQEFTANGKKS
jgi:hypothetical protein